MSEICQLVSAYNAAALPGSIFVNNTLNGVADILSYIVCAFIMEKIGRVKIMASTFGFAAFIAALCGILFYFGGKRNGVIRNNVKIVLGQQTKVSRTQSKA